MFNKKINPEILHFMSGPMLLALMVAEVLSVQLSRRPGSNTLFLPSIAEHNPPHLKIKFKLNKVDRVYVHLSHSPRFFFRQRSISVK